MCAIVDANAVSEVFGSSLPPAGEKFLEWLKKGSGRLMVGGKLLEELEGSSEGFRKEAQQLLLAGKMSIVNKSEVDARTEQIQSEGAIRSDDPHVLALAQVSGARLLYSNDKDLLDDFRDKKLIDNPLGKVYSTDKKKNPNKEFRSAHKKLLGRRDLCRVE